MMLRANLARILTETRALPRVLDVGGVSGPLNTATHLLDCQDFDSVGPALDPREPLRFSAATLTRSDICARPWPFPAGFFDYSFCSHTLEDIRDPIGVCQELMRVSRRGYIEVPSRLRESFHHKSGYLWRRIVGRPIRVGFGHHRWLCERTPNGIDFVAKTGTGLHSRAYFITAAELGRDLTSEEASIGLFWSGSFDVRERLMIAPGETEADYLAFKKVALHKAKQR